MLFKEERSNTTSKQLLGISLMVSVIIGFSLVLYLFPEQEVAILRYSLITLFSTLPATMYFIFIAWRKTSLFQEYISNLFQLGLFSCTRHLSHVDSDESKRRYFDRVRIHGYIQRFEGVYGPIKEEITEELINAADNNQGNNPQKKSAVLNSQSAGQIFSFSTSIPVFVATGLIAIGWFLYLPPQEHAGEQSDLMAVLAVNPNPILYGFIGAYFFSLQMLFRRFVTNDLRAKAFVGVSMRIVLSILGSWVLFMILAVQAIPAPTEMLALLAFVVGAFPTVLWRMARTAASKVTGQWLPSIDSSLPVRELDGLTVWHQARLEEEDIENAYNMANADIIELLLHTRIPADRAIDWIDQAMLLSCISPEEEDSDNYRQKRVTLKNHGICTASSIAEIYPKNYGFTEISTSRLKHENISDSALSLISATSYAVHNFTNLHLVRNWKSSIEIPVYNEIVKETSFAKPATRYKSPEPA